MDVDNSLLRCGSCEGGKVGQQIFIVLCLRSMISPWRGRLEHFFCCIMARKAPRSERPSERPGTRRYGRSVFNGDLTKLSAFLNHKMRKKKSTYPHFFQIFVDFRDAGSR